MRRALRAVPGRIARVAVPLALALLGGSLWTAGPASAHATLERSAPAANAHLGSEPPRVVLFFDEPVSLTLGTLTVLGPNGRQVATGYSTSDGGATVTAALRAGVGQGTYVVSYRVISADSHPVSGGFYFQVGHSSAITARAAPAPPAESAGAAEDNSVRGVYAACRYVGFLGLLLLVGGSVFLVGLWPRGVPDDRAIRLIWLGYALVAVASIGELVYQTPYAAGTGLFGITSSDFAAVVASTFGTAHLVRLALLAVAAPVLVGLGVHPGTAGSGSARPARWTGVSGVALAVVLGIGLLTTWAYSGHPATADPPLSVASDVVHLAAMAVWLGGLVLLAGALLPAAGGADLRAALLRWSRLAIGCVLALIISGSVQALVELAGWAELTDTTYGQLLLGKIGLLAVVVGIAAFSRAWVRRHFAAAGASTEPAGGAVRRFRRGVAAEILVAAAAVAVAAVLIQTSPSPASAVAGPAAGRHDIAWHGPYLAAVRRGNVVIHLKVDPAVVGVQYIYLGATRPDGARLRVRQWTLSVSNEDLGLERVNIPVQVISGVGHHFAYGSFTMSAGGPWTVQVIARTSDVDETVASYTVQVRS